MVKKFYEAPELELIQLTVEAGFAASLDTPAGSGGSDNSITDGDNSDSKGW